MTKTSQSAEGTTQNATWELNRHRNSKPFKLHSEYNPAGDQGEAIKQLVAGLNKNKPEQVLLGVTGSGKTFTMANIIQESQRPAIIMVHNKTLAAQLYVEMKGFFPENAVEYFVSYYDYYQPEAYIAKTDTFIEKDSAINDQIDMLRHSATISLMDRRDVIIVTSVSSIYGIGSPDTYHEMSIHLEAGVDFGRDTLLKNLVDMQYTRNDIEFARGTFRVRGDVVDIFPPYSDRFAVRVEFFGDEIETIQEFDTLTGKKTDAEMDFANIYPNSHHATPLNIIKRATEQILKDLDKRVAEFKSIGKDLEAQRLEQRTRCDVEMMLETGSCKGIENYSRYMEFREAGTPPSTMFHYLAKDCVLFVDESHVSVSQIKAMYAGDRARKLSLIEHGYRLPAAADNRPLMFEEWDKLRPQTIYVSATPAPFELERVKGEVVEQLIRPTGLLDPICEIRPVTNQVDDIINEVNKMSSAGKRSMIITLTKKMAEKLHEYLRDMDIKCMYIHSDTDTVERINILKMLRDGVIDVIIGINLLREGIDMPECAFLGIMDADKEGFLRSETALVQMIGRVARNQDGRVVLYADKVTNAIERSMSETARRRKTQEEFNKKHGITPQTILKTSSGVFDEMLAGKNKKQKGQPKKLILKDLSPKELNRIINATKLEMLEASSNLEFEKAARYRDTLEELHAELGTREEIKGINDTSNSNSGTST